MTWQLWVDDQLNDPETPERHTPKGFLGARSSQEAKDLVKARGMPFFMDLDHDLGETDRVMDFLVWLYQEHPDGPVPQFQVHSKNPIGTANIISYLRSWEASLK